MILDQTRVSCVPALQADILPAEPWGSPHMHTLSLRLCFPWVKWIAYTHKEMELEYVISSELQWQSECSEVAFWTKALPELNFHRPLKEKGTSFIEPLCQEKFWAHALQIGQLHSPLNSSYTFSISSIWFESANPHQDCCSTWLDFTNPFTAWFHSEHFSYFSVGSHRNLIDI